MDTSFHIRAAQPAEAPVLSALALRSKAHWGYDADFLRNCEAELTVTGAYIAAAEVYLLEQRRGQLGRIGGFYGLSLPTEEAEIAFFFMEPALIGQGLGRALWEHLTTRAAALGWRGFLIRSDPGAEEFYLKMGAHRIGSEASPVRPGRMLPLLRAMLPSA